MQILKIFTAALCLVLAQSAQAQIKFFNIYTNDGYDYGEGITQLSDSSYLVTGSSSSFGYGPSQAFIMHVDSMGNHLWAKSYGGTESDWGRRIFAVEGDGIYVAGYTNSTGNGSFDYYFFKTDMQGNLLFEKTYGGSKFEKLHGAVMMPDTTFILVGETISNETEVEDMYLMRLKANGDTIWTQTFGSPGKDIARNVNILNDTTFVVVGDYFTDSLVQKAFVMSMHVDGTILWTRFPGANGTFSLNDVTVNNGIVRAVGYNKRMNANNEEVCYLYRYLAQTNGTLIFDLIDENVTYSRLEYITSYGSQNKFYVAEQATSANTPVYPQGEDCFIQRYTEYLFWDNALLNTSYIGQDQSSQMIPTSDGGAILVGYNSAYGGGGANTMLIKIGPNDDYPASYTPPVENTLVHVKELSSDYKLSVYPNPVGSVLHISSEVYGIKNVFVTDAFGKVLQDSQFELAADLDFSAYSTGIYFVKIVVDGKQKVVKVVKC